MEQNDNDDQDRNGSLKRSAPAQVDYLANKVPNWVKEVIETNLAIEAEDAKSAGALGFMARALVIATMPYKDPKADVFTRENGDFHLRILAGYRGGIPYGVYPRLLLSWVATEAVRTQSPMIELGDSLSIFLREVMEVRDTGGSSGTRKRVAEQIKRLFGALITAEYTGDMRQRGFQLRNVLIAEGVDLDREEWDVEDDGDSRLWVPKEEWQSKVLLTDKFFKECIERPVPIDLRAYKILRDSPMSMDIYTWLTYRMSYTEKRSRPIRWEALMGQFGSSYGTRSAKKPADAKESRELQLQAVRDFKKAFLKALAPVLAVYPKARTEVTDIGLVLLPSPPHVAKQQDLF